YGRRLGKHNSLPLHRTKTLHLVRHARGIHQVETRDELKSEELFDAKLNPLGWQQVDDLHKHVHDSGLAKKVELIDVTPLMVKNGGNSNRSAISNINTPPFLAVELCRERLGVYPCNRRRNVSEYRTMFPAIDFSLIESEEDVWWKADVRETDESLASRGMQFINWLWTREEKEIAVVTHNVFLFETLRAFGKDCHPTVQEEICARYENCELRSVVIVDRGFQGGWAIKNPNWNN
ncbi:hypothetical protein MKW92_006058, partial [Papaver armeniacum]